MFPSKNSPELQIQENSMVVSLSDDFLLYEKSYDLEGDLKDKILQVMEVERCEKVQIDLGEASRIDAAGINTLISLKKEVEKRDKEFEVLNIASEYVRRVLKIARVEGWLNQDEDGSFQF